LLLPKTQKTKYNARKTPSQNKKKTENKLKRQQNQKKTKHKKNTPLRPIRSGGGKRVAPFATNWAHCVQWQWCAA